jgi:hypothetical protein
VYARHCRKLSLTEGTNLNQDRIDPRRVAPVRASVADEPVVGIVRHVGPVPTNSVGCEAYSPKPTPASQKVTTTLARIGRHLPPSLRRPVCIARSTQMSPSDRGVTMSINHMARFKMPCY